MCYSDSHRGWPADIQERVVRQYSNKAKGHVAGDPPIHRLLMMGSSIGWGLTSSGWSELSFFWRSDIPVSWNSLLKRIERSDAG